MEHLQWTQNNENVFLIVDTNNNKLNIKIEPKILSILVSHSPKIFYLHINLNKENLSYMIDFTDLKPIIKQQSKLKIQVKSKNDIKAQSLFQPESNFYKISRGESFMERYLGINGWQSQEFAFPFEPDKDKILEQQNSQEHKISTKFSEINQPKEHLQKDSPKLNIQKQSNSNIQECKKCGFIIADNIDYCPKCFAPFFEAEKDVDFSI